jgi:hypothetical protein
MSRERAQHSLQSTALVNEAYLRRWSTIGCSGRTVLIFAVSATPDGKLLRLTIADVLTATPSLWEVRSAETIKSFSLAAM